MGGACFLEVLPDLLPLEPEPGFNSLLMLIAKARTIQPRAKAMKEMMFTAKFIHGIQVLEISIPVSENKC